MGIKNKRGWLRIIEAFLGIMLLLIALLLFIQERKPDKNPYEEKIKNMQNKIIEKISEEPELRAAVLSENKTFIEESIKKFLEEDKSINISFEVKICNITDLNCSMSSYPGKDVFSKERIISSNLTKYQPLKLKLFFWEG